MKKVFQIGLMAVCFISSSSIRIFAQSPTKPGPPSSRYVPEDKPGGGSSLQPLVFHGTPNAKPNTSALNPSSSPQGNGSLSKKQASPAPKKITTTKGCGVAVAKLGPILIPMGTCGSHTVIEPQEQ